MNLTTSTLRAPSEGNAYDLAVCLRIYPLVSGTPIFGFTNKLELVRLSLLTFKEAKGSLHVKLWVLLDNCPLMYQETVESLLAECTPEFIQLPGIGNAATFSRQIEVLLNQEVADLVYFAEDDYLYLPGALERGVTFMKRHRDADFLTLYDHPDYHTRYIHRVHGLAVTEDGLRWRQVVSSCLTFMTRRDVLAETAHVLRTYSRKNSDLGMWLALTKTRVLSAWSFIRSFGDGKFVPASYLLAWWYGWRYILLGKRRTLWAPEPTLATHMESKYIAPGVEWEKLCEVKRIQSQTQQRSL